MDIIVFLIKYRVRIRFRKKKPAVHTFKHEKTIKKRIMQPSRITFLRVVPKKKTTFTPSRLFVSSEFHSDFNRITNNDIADRVTGGLFIKNRYTQY